MIHSSKSSPVLNNPVLLEKNKIDVQTQTHDINQYLIQLLAKEIKELKECKTKIKKLHHIANSDVENLIDSLLHNINDIDKQMYKTGVKFMKQTVSNILLE